MEPETFPTLGEILKEERAIAGLKIEEVAAAIGLSVGTVGNYENDKCANPTLRVVWALTRLYDIDLEDVVRWLGWDDDE